MLVPLCVSAGGREVTITASRDRALLATLRLYANEPVQTDRLIDAIWDVDPSRNARNQLQGCVSRIRRRLVEAGLERQAIVTEPAGYRAVVDAEHLDLLLFRRLLAEARAASGAGQHPAAGASYRAALALWRGPAFAGYDSQLLTQAAAALEEERAQALQERFEIELVAGAGGELVAELTASYDSTPTTQTNRSPQPMRWPTSSPRWEWSTRTFHWI